MKQVQMKSYDSGRAMLRGATAAVGAAKILPAGLIALLATFGSSALDPAPARAAEAGGCDAGEFICGMPNIEDLVRIPNSPWVLASSLPGAGVTGDKLYLIDLRDRSHREIDPSAAPVKLDPQFDGCPGKLAPGVFRGHGIDVGANPPRFYAVNHGGRESVEIFDIVTEGGTPSLRWVGCVVAPADVSINAVVPLPDGGLAVTRFYDRRDTHQQWLTKLMDGEATGLALEWHAKTGWSRVPESEMAGANGLLVSPDGRSYFIAGWGSGRLIRLSRGPGRTRRDSIELDLRPDNLRWDDKGDILVTGQVMKDLRASMMCRPSETVSCVAPYRVVRVHPTTLKVEPVFEEMTPKGFTKATVAIEAGDELWLGTMSGDRVRRVGRKAAPPR